MMKNNGFIVKLLTVSIHLQKFVTVVLFICGVIWDILLGGKCRVSGSDQQLNIASFRMCRN